MKRFKKIYLEITNVCNLRCAFCSETKRLPGFMEPETFQNILGQIRPYTDYVCFHVKGEPLLHPALEQFLDLCADCGLLVNITTNGTLIGEAAEKLLGKPSLRQISFSLHSYDGNASGDNKDDYLNGIFSFARRSAAASQTLISLRLWNLGQGDTDPGKTRKNREVLSKIESAFRLEHIIEEKISSTYGIKIAEKVYLSQDSEFEWPALDMEEDFGSGFCYGLRSQIAVLVDGTVVPCCLDGEGVINLGNIHETPFSEIIRSERALMIHRGFSKREVTEELCRKCTYRKRFN